MASITLTGIAKRYGRQAPTIEGLDLAIRDGDFVVILGPSGCGKSTLLRLIAGLEEVSAGAIAIDGRLVNEVEPKGRGCAMVFQNYALYPHMSVAQNIGYALKVAGVPRAEREARVRRVAEVLGLADYLERRPAALSGGQRQRVAMGRAMIREPKVFLFDEPLSNLDAKLRVQMRLEIRRLHQRLKATSVFVTHDQVEAMTLADQLVVMNRGRIEQVGTPAEVYKRPATRFVAEFMGSPPLNILRARLCAGGEAELDGGGHLPLPQGLDLPLGTPVDLGFRAEAATLDEGNGPGLPFDIDLTEDLGTAHLLHGRVGDAPVVVSVPPGTPTPASRTRLRVPTSALHLFDAAHGMRLDAAPFALAAE